MENIFSDGTYLQFHRFDLLFQFLILIGEYIFVWEVGLLERQYILPLYGEHLHPDDQLVRLTEANIFLVNVSQHFEEVLRRVDDVKQVRRHVVFGVSCKEYYLVLIGLKEEY